MDEDQKKYNRVVAYIRKSSEDNKQGEANKQLNSLEYQQNFVKRALQQYDLKLVRPVFEDDKSGYDAFIRDGENGFNAMLTYLKEHRGEVDGIVCTEISRLARNFADGGMILWYMQNDTIKRIYTPTKVFTNSSSDQLMVAIEFAMSKKSSDDTGYRTKAGMKSKAHTMKHPARRPILGYFTRGPVGQKEWIIDPKTGPLVKQIFEQFATDNFNIKEISEYAYTIGLKSKDRQSTKGVISPNTWITRLKDIQYTGIFYYEGETIVGAYEPLISTELFYQVQDIFEGNKHPKSTHIDYAYSGLIQCARCGGSLSGTNKRGITYYRCGKKKSPCREQERIPYMPEGEIEVDLMKAFESIEIDHDTWKIAREYVVELNQPEKAEQQKRIRMLYEQITKEESMQIELGRKFAQRELPKSEYDRLMKDSYAKEASLRNSIVKCENVIHEITELMYTFLDNIKYIAQRFHKASALNKKELVEVFCENIIWDYKKLRWDWLKPYYILTNQPKNSAVLPR